MKYRNKETGEIVEAWAKEEIVLFRLGIFSLTRSVPTEDFHSQYEPVKEDE